MAGIFHYRPHPHAEERKAMGAPTVARAAAQLHGPGIAGRLNARLGVTITAMVGTMWCAYLFTALALVSAPSAFGSGSALIIVSWVAQTFLQLVLLPVIIVGQNAQSAAADARAELTYRDAAALLEEMQQVQAHLLAQDEVLDALRAVLAKEGQAR